jgi:competence protein ComEA
MLTMLAMLAVTTPALAGVSSTPQASTAAPAGLVNLNTASASDLETLPGIGARTALLIIEYREANGGFKKIEELMNVRGIGEKSFLTLKPHITVTPPPASGRR